MIGVVVIMAWVLWHDWSCYKRTEEIKEEIQRLREEVAK